MELTVNILKLVVQINIQIYQTKILRHQEVAAAFYFDKRNFEQL